MRRWAIVLALAALPAFGQDAVRGRLLYETHCGACHYERIHQRPRERRTVASLAGLRIEVAKRAAQVGRPFTVEDLDDIAEYLNRSHYRLQE